MKRNLLLVLAILIVEATGLHAQTNRGTEQNPITLNDSIAVTANRTPTPISEIASSITVITREEIQKSQSAFVSHLLRNVPSLDVVQSGGEGKLTSIFIRGANSHHTLVLLDGIPLNDPSSPNNAVDLSNLMINNIERIEIIRGPQSVLYGPEAIGGVVQLFTKAGENKYDVSLSTEAGSNERYDINASLSGTSNKFSYSLAAGHFETGGISAAVDSPEDDGYHNTSLSSRIDYLLASSLRLDLTARYIDSESDLDKTSVVFDDPNFYSTQKEQQYSVRLFHQPADSKWQQQVQFCLSDINRTTQDNFDIDHPSDSEFTESQGKRFGFNFQQTVQLNQRHSLLMGAETERASFTSDLFFRSGYGDFVDNVSEKYAWTRGLFLFDQIQIAERLFLSAGGRIDEHKQFGTTGTYRFTAAYHFDKTNTRLRGVIGTGYKAPSVFQLYHPSAYLGNPDLQPEKSQSWETGFDQEIVRNTLTASLTYYHNNYNDLIVGVENVAEASSKGIESALELKQEKYRLRLDYIYCDSKDDSTNDELIRRPTHSVIFSTSIQSVKRLSLNLTAKHTGKRFDQDFSQFPATRVELEGYTVVNLATAITLNNFLELTGRLDNLFDETYQEIYGYGNMPFSVYAGIRLSN